MLVEFSVSNYKSFLEEQKLSLVASNYEKEHREHLIDPQVKGMEKAKLLRGAALYGANASGKTNLLQALVAFSRMVVPSANRSLQGDLFELVQFVSASTSPSERGFATFFGSQPFRLIASPPDDARTGYHAKFIANGVLYGYRVELDRHRILLERLVTLGGSNEVVWYERRFDDESGDYKWSHPSGHIPSDPALQSKTRQDVLYLSVGYTFNSPQLTPVHQWFSGIQSLADLHEFGLRTAVKTAGLLVKDLIAKDELVGLVGVADFGVSGLKLVELPSAGRRLRAAARGAGQSAGYGEGEDEATRSMRVQLVHRGIDGSQHSLPFAAESEGTKQFLSLAGPLLHARASGGTLVVDEVESSLHPMLVRELLRLVLQPKRGTAPTQIIFATHNPLLLEGDLLRRDQVWFTEKDREGRSHLYPLSDFKPRKGEALSKGYMAGRYGGVPFIPAGLLP